jgi:hypothetical protein
MSNLWRITRVEVDHIGRYQFSVIPVRLPHGLPAPKFEDVEPLVREQLHQHWAELERAYIEHRSYALVTAAKNIGESLLVWRIGDPNSRKRQDIGNLLPKLKTMLETDAKAADPGFSLLDYHLLSKLRILHGRTHADRAAHEPLTPELALTAAEDIVAVLGSLGLTAGR